MILVVEGNIGAGKSTLLDAIGENIASRIGKNHVVVMKEPVTEWCKNDLLKRFYEDVAGNSLQLQIVISMSMFENERTAVNLHERGKVVLMERSLMSTQRVFGRMIRHNPAVSEEDKDLLEHFHDRFRPRVTAVHLGCKSYRRLCVRTPVSECLRRIRARGREGEEHITEEYLKKIETGMEVLMNDEAGHDTRHSSVLDGSYDKKDPMSAIVETPLCTIPGQSQIQTQSLDEYLTEIIAVCTDFDINV